LNEKLEKRIQKIEKIKLTKDQVKFKEELDKQYEDYYVATKEQLAEKLSKQNDNFEKRLADEYEKACKSIKFNEIEYKKTITKKEKDYNAKNGKFAKPERKWRYIDEE
jgi:ABC-type phosphate transport system auxiliary subunit